MACLVDGNEIVLTGTVGGIWWDEDHFTYEDVLIALAQVGRTAHVTVRLNSGGGVASEGAAIHSALSMHRGGVDVVIEGWAASAASLLAMAGQRVVMRPGAILMIHDPSGLTWGPADAHRASADALDTLGNAYAQIYAAKAGKTVPEVRAMMKREVWMGPDDAVAQGFADAAEGPSNDNDAPDLAAFGGIRHYANAPSRVVAMARADHWHRPDPPQQTGTRPAAFTSPEHKEKPVSEQAQTGAGTVPAPTHQTAPTANLDPAKIAADAVAADRKRRADVLALAETKGREALAEHLLSKTDMAPEAIKAAMAAAPVAGASAADGAQAADDAPNPDAYAASRAAAAGAGLAAPGSQKPARASLSARDIYTQRRQPVKEA